MLVPDFILMTLICSWLLPPTRPSHSVFTSCFALLMCKPFHPHPPCDLTQGLTPPVDFFIISTSYKHLMASSVGWLV